MIGGSRKNSQKLFFEFDSLVDLDLGTVLALQEDYPPGELFTINYSFLHQSLDGLKQARVFLYGRDVVQECFKDKNIRASYQTIKDTYRNQKRVYNLAPRTALVNYVKVCCNTGFLHCTILCHNQFEFETAMDLLGHTPNCSIAVGKEKNYDINDYARVHVGDIHELDLFNPFDCTHLAVLNYGSNLQVMDHDVILLREYIIKYGDTNVFEIIDSYINVKCPDYGRIS